MLCGDVKRHSAYEQFDSTAVDRGLRLRARSRSRCAFDDCQIKSYIKSGFVQYRLLREQIEPKVLTRRFDLVLVRDLRMTASKLVH